jgi:hypothetical protein
VEFSRWRNNQVKYLGLWPIIALRRMEFCYE